MTKEELDSLYRIAIDYSGKEYLVNQRKEAVEKVVDYYKMNPFIEDGNIFMGIFALLINLLKFEQSEDIHGIVEDVIAEKLEKLNDLMRTYHEDK